MKFFLAWICISISFCGLAQEKFSYVQGGIIRGDTTSKEIALMFSADEFTDGLEFILNTLEENKVKASFFFTGKVTGRPEFGNTLRRLLKNGHYLGSHSHGHLLYCDWSDRDSLLVSEREFRKDLKRSYRDLKKYGVTRRSAPVFLPPYEWYNQTISEWTGAFGLRIINFTPGTYSNADYTTPDMGSRYLSSDTIYNRILRYETDRTDGLNGFLLLLHAGTHPDRTDKFYHRLPELLSELKNRGYRFRTVRDLLNKQDD